MQREKICLLLTTVLLVLGSLQTYADSGAYSGAGGVFSYASAVGGTISGTSVPLSGTTAAYSFSCSITSYGAGTYQVNWTCAGGTVSITSSDNSIAMQGTLLSGTMTLTSSGGGKGSTTHYYYNFNGRFSATVTTSTGMQAVYGSLTQNVTTTSKGSGRPVTSASLGWNSAYSPLITGNASDSSLTMADNITGANSVTYGSAGTGTGNFGAIAGLAQDASGRIYAVDSSLNRLVRIDDMTGKNWTALGSLGAGVNQFSSPRGVAVDGAGKIWIADSGNNRVVRMDDMTGKNWTTFGTMGSGANQFSGPTGVALDGTGRVYVADGGNNRLVRFDDLSGTNWTTLSQVNVGIYGYLLTSAMSVSVGPSGRIFVATSSGTLLSVDDMTGANGKVSMWGNSLSSMSVDRSGTIYVPDRLHRAWRKWKMQRGRGISRPTSPARACS